MPDPRADESRADFVDRCMGDSEAVADYPDAGQRFAVCNAKWEDRDKMGEPERKTMQFPCEIKMDGDGNSVEGWASVFDIKDQGGDTVTRGAYGESLARMQQAGRSIKMLWQHDPSQPIGVWDEVRETSAGLYVKGRILPEVEKGREAVALIRAGALDGLSIGYRTIDAERMPGGGRKLTKLDLWEVSLVTFPMQREARTTSIKGEPRPADIERALRDTGFSRDEAKAMAAAAWKRRTEILRDADIPAPEIDPREVGEIMGALTQLLTTMKGNQHV